MKKFLISILVLLTFSVKVFSLNSVVEVCASDSTDISHPGEYAIDGDRFRGWELDKEESQGWISLTLDNPLVINGLRFSGYLSEYTRYNIGYKDESGIIRDFFSGLDRVILEEQLIDLSFDRVIADNLYIRIIENSNVRSSITNIEILGEDPTLGLKKKAVEEIVATENTSPYSIEDNLVDGKSGTFWRVEKDLKWSKVHWAVKDFLDNVVKTKKEKHEKDKKGKKDKKDKHNKTNDYEGFVEFTLNKEVSKIRFYVPEGDKGIYSIEGESNEGTKSLANSMPLDEGWLETTFDPLVFTTIKLVIESYDKKDFPKIGEVEFWGENDYQIENKEYLSPYYEPGPYEADNNNYFEWSRKDETPILELVVDKSSEESIILNGEIINALEVLILDSNKVLTFRPEDTQLFDGYNFINKEGVLGVRLRNDLKIGSYFSSEDVLTDSILLTVNPDNDGIVVLDKDVFIERVELYSVNGVSPVLYVFNNEEWEEIYSIERKDNRIIYSGGLTTNLLKVAYGEDIVSEMKIFGSYIDNKKPEIEILYPYDGLDMISHLPGYSVFIGRVNDPEAEITINGKTAKKYGNIFWIEMKKLKLPKSGFFPIEVIATGTTGLITKKDIEILIQHNGYRDSVDGEDLIFTSDDTILIEGTSNQWRSKLYINDVKYSIDGMKFSHELPLEPGFNQFKIDFRDKKGKIVKLFYKRVFRETSNLTLVLSNSYNDILTRKDEITINGFVKGFGEVTVDINGIKAAVNGFSFHSEKIALSEGVNVITINATDELGNNQSRIINVIKDTIAPSVSEVLPLKDTIISFREVNITGVVTEDLGTRVFVNGHIATLSDDLSFAKELTFPDGINSVSIYTVDKAGNKSEVFTTQVVTDTTPPNDFDVFADPDVWTNNVTPEMTFTTTDVTTSIAYYEAKVDSGSWTTVIGPYVIPAQADGTHTVTIRAIDDAGHRTVSSTEVFIDTTPPENSTVFRSIPRRDSVDLAWVPSVSEDTIEYRVVRTPNWSGGDKIFTKTISEYTDTDVLKNIAYGYELFTVDKAYNNSPGIESEIIVVGLAVKEFDNTTGGVVEYENLSLIIPEESLPEDVIEIHMTEIDSPELEELAVNTIIGPIYSTSVVKEVNGKRVAEDHVAFEKDFLASFTYDEADFPDGFPEQNIGVYYFDEMWGRWFLVEDSAVDKENKRILFTTNHFTDFSVQPVMSNQLSPQDYRSMGVSPFTSGHSSVNVDPQSGSVSMSVEEFSLPGKAGFDFTLRRTYSSTRARKDSLNMALAKSLEYTLDPTVDVDIVDKLQSWGVTSKNKVSATMKANLLRQYQNNGDYAYSMGAGWRFDLPSINNSDNAITVTIPGGATYSLNQMDMVPNTIDLGSTNLRAIVLENHESSDFTIIIKQAKAKLSSLKSELFENGSIVTGAQASALSNRWVASWSMYQAELILKDGTTYIFDSLGRISQKIDPFGRNETDLDKINKIDFNYNGDRLSTIVDSMDRVISFNYDQEDGEGNLRFVPSISEISIKDFFGADNKVVYTIDEESYLGLLKSATDLKGRVWNYDYKATVLASEGNASIAVNEADLLNNYLNPGGINSIAQEVMGVETLELSGPFQAQWVDVLTSVTGPGIGTTSLEYKSEAMIFKNSVGDDDKDDFNGLYPSENSFSYNMLEKLVTDKKTVSGGSEDNVKTYKYNFEYADEKQFTNSQTDIKDINNKRIVDGKVINDIYTTSYYYRDFLKKRVRWFSVSDDKIDDEDKSHTVKYDNIPKNYKVEILDENSTVIKTTNLGYNHRTLKLNFRNESYKNGNSKTTSLEYDNWGNVVFKGDYSGVNDEIDDRFTSLETWTEYAGTTNEHLYNDENEASEDDIPAYTWTPSDLGYVHNLVKSVVVKNKQPTISGNEDIIQFRSFKYDINLRKSVSRIYDDSKWIDTSYGYDTYGNVNLITNSDKSTVTNTWDYISTGSPWYTLIRTINNINQVDELGIVTENNSISTKVAFEKNTGLKAWEKNGRGFYTQYAYDSIGRLLVVKKDSPVYEDSNRKPVSSIEPKAKLTTIASDLFQEISYDDTNFTSTVLNAESAKTVYKYNVLGQLTNIYKYLDPDIVTTFLPNDKILTTTLTYDSRGNVSTVDDPMGKITSYDYDVLNRNRKVTYPNTEYSVGGSIEIEVFKTMDFDYTTNTLITVDEEKNKTYQFFDMYNRVVESGYFKTENLSTKIPLGKTYYDGLGNVAVQIDGKANKVINTYNERNLLSQTTFPTESFYEDGLDIASLTPYVKYGYNDRGQRTNEYRSTKNSEEDYETTFYPDVLGRIYQIKTPVTGEVLDIIQKFGFDANGNKTHVIDGNNNVTRFVYNSFDHMTSMEDAENNVTKFVYDKLGNRERMIDPREGSYEAGFTIDYEYDDLNRLDFAVLPRSYNQVNRNIIDFDYDKNGNVLSRVEAEGTVSDSSIVINKTLSKIKYEYNDRNMLLKQAIVSPDGSLEIPTNYTYNTAGLKTSVRDGRGKDVSTEYDEIGRPKLTTYGSGIVEQYVWDLNGNQTEFTVGSGFDNKTTSTAYDSLNRVTTVTSGRGLEETSIKYKYDIRGNKTYFEDGKDRVTTFDYDELNRMIEETTPRGSIATYSYDAVGNIKGKIDFNESEFFYDYSRNNLLENVNILGGDGSSKILTYEYDEAGSLKLSTDDGVTTKYNFIGDEFEDEYQPDPFDKISNISTNITGDSNSSYSVRYDYDTAGRLSTLTYPDSHSVLSTYNDLGQLQGLGDYLNQETSISYEDNGLLSSYILGNDIVYSASYDDGNRLEYFDYSGQDSPINDYGFTYDDFNNILTKTVDSKVNEYTWDSLNQLTRAVNRGEFEIDPTKLDNVQKVGKVQEDYVGEKSLDFNIDDADLMLDFNSMSIGFDLGVNAKLNRFVIRSTEANNRLRENKIALYYSSDNINWVKLSRDEWSYVDNGESVELSLKDPLEPEDKIQARYVKIHCFYDDRTMTGTTNDRSTIKNQKDKLVTAYFTVTSMTEGFGYDLAGNRVTSTVSYSGLPSTTSTYKYYDNSNLIKTDGKFAYKWDNNGNLTEKSDSFEAILDNGNSVTLHEAVGNYTKYEYDLLNRLTRVSISSEGKTGIAKVVEYVYDHRGYRIKRTSGEDYTYFTFGLNGEILHKEILQKDTVTQNVTLIQKENYIYLFGKHLAKEITTGEKVPITTRLYYHTDNLGSTIAITDTDGDKIWSNDYTSFGNSTKESGLIEEVGIYTSKEIDPDTGLYYYNARWYDPTLGRFITEDPIKDGNNWHIYCSNNPINYIDPTGLYRTDYWNMSDDDVKKSRKTRDEIDNGTIGGNKKKSKSKKSAVKSEAEKMGLLLMELENDRFGETFSNMSGEQQMDMLNDLYNLGDSLSGYNKGRIAEKMRALRRGMKLDSLFKQDKVFMNGVLRDFLNLNFDGSDNYEEKNMEESGFSLMQKSGSIYHQSDLVNNELNHKYVHKDGREVVFYSDGTINKNKDDYGTFNYVNGTASNSLSPGGGHYDYDVSPYFEINKKGQKPNVVSLFIFSAVRKY